MPDRFSFFSYYWKSWHERKKIPYGRHRISRLMRIVAGGGGEGGMGGTSNSEHLPIFRAPCEGKGRSAPVHGRGTLRPGQRKKKITWEGDKQQTDIATTRPNRPSGPIRWKSLNKKYTLLHKKYATVLQNKEITILVLAVPKKPDIDYSFLPNFWNGGDLDLERKWKRGCPKMRNESLQQIIFKSFDLINDLQMGLLKRKSHLSLVVLVSSQYFISEPTW